MFVGEVIYSNRTRLTYVVLQTMKSGGQAEIAFAKSNKSDKVYFIKRLLNIKYSSNKVLRDRCKDFEDNRRRLYSSINSYTMPGASCSYIYDFFREKSFYYVVTERIIGLPLNTKDIFNALSPNEIISLFRIIAYSFLPFEKSGIIHGDVKPENIIIKEHGDILITKLTDYESCFYAVAPPSRGYIVGTEPYYSPELAAYNIENGKTSEHVLSTKTDIFSLGVVLYEMLTGKYPNNGNNSKYCFEIVKDREIEIPKSWPKDLKQIVLQMLSFESSKRPSVIELLSALNKVPTIPLYKTSVVKPSLFVDRTNEGYALVTVINVNRDAEISYSINNQAIRSYNSPIKIVEDDIPLRIEVTKMGKSTYFEYNVSLSSELRGKVSKPLITVDAGMVTVVCTTPDSSIYYTIDGKTPSKSSREYKGVFYVAENVTIKAIAFCLGMHPSEITSFNSSSKIKMH